MSNSQKEVKSTYGYITIQVLKYKPHISNFELSSKWILTRNPNSVFYLFIFFLEGGGTGVEGGGGGL